MPNDLETVRAQVDEHYTKDSPLAIIFSALLSEHAKLRAGTNAQAEQIEDLQERVETLEAASQPQEVEIP